MENENFIGLSDYKLSKKVERVDFLLLEIKKIARKRLDLTNFREIEKRIKKIKEILGNK